MITIKRSAHVEGVKYLVYLSYVDGVLIDEVRVNNTNLYQSLNVMAPTGKDILLKERVHYSDDDYHETERLLKYQPGNIKKRSVFDINPVIIHLDGSNIVSTYVSRLSADVGKVWSISKFVNGDTDIRKGVNGILTRPHENLIHSVVAWGHTSYGDSGITYKDFDPFTKEEFPNTDDLPMYVHADTHTILNHTFQSTSTLELRTIDLKLIATFTPVNQRVTVPGRFLKDGHKLVFTIVRPGTTNISRVVSVIDQSVIDGEIPTGKVSLSKMYNELRFDQFGNYDPYDREFYRTTDGQVDPLLMAKLRLDGYESYDDTIYSVEDKCLYRYNGSNMTTIPLDSFTDLKLPEDTKFIYRSSDGIYMTATREKVSLYTSAFKLITEESDTIRYITGGYFFSRTTIYYGGRNFLDSIDLPPELISYIPTYTQHGFIHFIATNETPRELPMHIAMDIKTFEVIPLGESNYSINVVTGGSVTHACMGLDGDPLIVSDDSIYKYDITVNKYKRICTVPEPVVAFYRLDDYIIIKTGTGRHYKLVMDT